MFDFLIVDDEIWVARLLSQIIDWEKEGFRLIGICSSSAEAVSVITERKPHLVLTDIKMPGMTGLELIETTQKHSPDTQFVIVSGYNDFSYAKEAISLRAMGYLLKPVDEKELLKVIRYVRNQLIESEEKQRRSTDMENIYLQANEFRKNRLMADLLHGNVLDADSEYRSIFNGKREEQCFLTVIYVTESGDIEAAKAGFDLTMEIHMARNYVCCSCIDDHLIAALFTCKTQEAQIVWEQLETEFNRLLDKSGNNLYMGIGKPMTRLEDLHLSYNDARDSLTSRWVLKDKRVFRNQSDLNSSALVGSICSLKVEVELLQAIKSYDEPSIQRIISDIIGQAFRWAEKNPRVLPAAIEWVGTLIREEAAAKGDRRGSEAEQIDIELRNIYYVSGIQHVCSVLMACIRKFLLMAKDRNAFEGDEGIIEKAKAFIDMHYVQDIGLNDVADAVHLNPNYLSTLFKQETGVTYKEYLTQKRIEKAKNYLKDSRMSVNEISNAIGYNEVKSFLRIFKKNVGITPGDYRKLMSKNGK